MTPHPQQVLVRYRNRAHGVRFSVAGFPLVAAPWFAIVKTPEWEGHEDSAPVGFKATWDILHQPTSLQVCLSRKLRSRERALAVALHLATLGTPEQWAFTSEEDAPEELGDKVTKYLESEGL